MDRPFPSTCPEDFHPTTNMVAAQAVSRQNPTGDTIQAITMGMVPKMRPEHEEGLPSADAAADGSESDGNENGKKQDRANLDAKRRRRGPPGLRRCRLAALDDPGDPLHRLTQPLGITLLFDIAAQEERQYLLGTP